jgi:hypothetical protein
MNKKPLIGPHGIDLRAPGGIEALFAFNRSLYGDAVMEAGEGGEGGTPPAGNPPAGDPPPTADPALDAMNTDAGKKALQTERDARSQAEKDLADALEQIKQLKAPTPPATPATGEDDASKNRVTELEKDISTKDTAIAERDAKLLRYEVAAAKGLDLKAALRLQGATKEELEADADDFAKSFIPGGVGEVPGAGAIGSTVRPKTTPGIGTLTHAYETAGK